MFLEKKGLKKLLLLQALIGGGSPAVERIALGNPLTFGTDLARPLVSLEIPFTPIQEGSGDPSPSNIRSILPWNGLKVWNGGKNMYSYDETKITQETTSDGKTRAVYHTGLKNGSYALSGSLKEGQTAVSYGVNEGILKDGIAIVKNTFITTTDVVNRSLVVGADEEIILINTADSISDMQQKLSRYNLQIELGSSAKAYEAPHITDTDIVFPSAVYGGTLDVVSGVLTVEWEGFSATWGDGVSAKDVGSGITRKIFPMVDYLTTGFANNMCNIAPYSANENESVHFYYSGSGATNRNCRLFLPSDTPDSTEVTVITKLSQTYEVQLTGEQITALVGDNTIWSDADGSMTCVYLVSSKYADEHPVGGLGFGFGSGSSDPDEPAEPADPENPDESEEPIIDDSENNQIEGE